MFARYSLCFALAFAGGCANKRSAATQVSPDAAPAQSQATKADAKLQELALGFDPIFANKPKDTVNKPDGLRVEDYRVGTGDAVQVGSEVSLRFIGYLKDGTVFDERSNPQLPPFRFKLPQKPRIRGWGLGLAGMRAGGVRKFVVPPKLGYGDEGDPGDEDVPPIPPNSTLTYLVKMLEVTPPPPKPQPESAFSAEPLSRQKLPGGLVVQDFKTGTGPAAQDGDSVTVYVRGYLPDGKLFSSPETTSQPFVFKLGDPRVLPGWNKGLVGMQVNGLRKLTVPPKMAYGKKQVGPIPANSKLTFTFELLELVKADAQTPGPDAAKPPN